jgi:hypothetical protein
VSVGAVLLQPQRVRRTATAHDGGPIYDDAIALAVRISFDAAHGGRILELLEEACEGAATRLVARIDAIVSVGPVIVKMSERRSSSACARSRRAPSDASCQSCTRFGATGTIHP